MSVQMKDVIKAYLQLRNACDAIEAEAKAQVKVHKEKMAKLESYMQMELDRQGSTSVKTDAGTAFVSTTDFAAVADWDQTLNFIKEQGAFDMLEKRVSKMAVRAYIEEHKAVPPGVNYGTKVELVVRKPTAKAED